MENFSVLSWNIQGEANLTGYTFRAKIRPHLAGAMSDIIALQECVKPELLCEGTDILKRYTLLASKKNADRSSFPFLSNDNVILTKHPVQDFHDLPFPELGQKRPLENYLRADINVHGTLVRIYNCHFPILRAGPNLRVKLLEHLLTESREHPGPVIVCGDLNTNVPKSGFGRFIVKSWHWQPAHDFIVDGRELETAEHELIYQTLDKHGFKEASHFPHPTWSIFKSRYLQPWRLKLDWLMVKGLNVTQTKLGAYISDHRAIEAKVSIK